MTAAASIDLTLNFRKRDSPSSSHLLFKLPNGSFTDDRHHPISPSAGWRSSHHRQRTLRPTSRSIDVSVRKLDLHNASCSSHDWQRYADRRGHLTPAPDVAYRNTYLEPLQRTGSARTQSDGHARLVSASSSCSSHSQQRHQQQAPRLQTSRSSSFKAFNSSQQKHDHFHYSTIYEYIRESIRQIEQQRQLRPHYFSNDVKRANSDLSSRSPDVSKAPSRLLDEQQHSHSFNTFSNRSREASRSMKTTTPIHPHRQF